MAYNRPDAPQFIGPINPAASGAGLPVALTHIFNLHWLNSAALAANRVVHVCHLQFQLTTLVAAAATQLFDFELIRTTGQPGGGTAVTPARRITGGAAPVALFVVNNTLGSGVITGLTPTNGAAASAGDIIGTLNHSRLGDTITPHDFDWSRNGTWPIVLRPGEGLSLRNITAPGAAQTWAIKGHIEWSET